MPPMQNSTEHRPPSSFPKQAVVMIHGMGEQKPMDTIKGFVEAVWETDTDITRNTHPNPTETWSKPDLRTGSYELRRITTRESIATPSFTKGVRTDFYELYWADLLEGSTWSHIKDWISELLFRDPFSRVPRKVMLAWLLLWLISIAVVVIGIAAALPKDATLFGQRLWDTAPLRPLASVEAWHFALLAAVYAFIIHKFVQPYFGDVVRYTRATPVNIAARKNARERGLALLTALHEAEYERIIIVAHSLGTILAYDLISYFWATRPQAYTVQEGTAEFAALCAIEEAARDLAEGGTDVTAYRAAQTKLCRMLRRRSRPTDGTRDPRWLITDFVTVGSPLTHAEFLLANSPEDLDRRREGREFPTNPPIREQLDDEVRKAAKAAGLPVSGEHPRLMSFRFAGKWQLHHAAPFAVVRWTNIHDPADLVFLGDVISGPAAPAFGRAIEDIDLRALRGQSLRFTHTDYWRMRGRDVPKHIAALRKALDLAGKDRLL
jgi:hypothetical protein